MNEEGLIKIYNICKKVLSYIAVSFSCLIIVFLLLNTILSNINANNTNYKPIISLYTIVSPSMEPVIDVYDVVVNVKVNNAKNIEVGDIITFKSKSSVSEGMTITHRVIEKTEISNGKVQFKTQGDNNNGPDAGYVEIENIIGKKIFIIPKLGNLQFLLSSSKGWMFLILLPISYFIIKDVFELIDLLGLKRKVTNVIKDENKIEKTLEEEERKEELKQKLHINEEKVIKPSNLNLELPKIKEETKIQEEIKVQEEKKDQIKQKVQEELKQEINEEIQTKLDEYDKKIAELDKMIKELENNSKTPKKLEVKEENYLKESKIRVVNEEVAKKRKQPTKKKKEVIYIKPKGLIYIEKVPKKKK